MNKYILLILVIFFLTSCNTSRLSEFKKDFKNVLSDDFDKKQFSEMLDKYPELRVHSDVISLSEALLGNQHEKYPLKEFINDDLYKDNIDQLINNGNPFQKTIAYMVIASGGDSTKVPILLEKIKTETDEYPLMWSGMALLYMKCNHTTALFDFFCRNQNLPLENMFPLYFQFNKDSLQKTAYNRIHSEDDFAKILSAQMLSVTPLNKKTEELLLNAAKNWNIKIKGYAIYSIKELRIGNLLETFKPLIDSSKTSKIALEALANSPTDIDVQYVYSLVEQADTVSEDLLDCLCNSNNINSIRYCLKVLYTKPIPKDYQLGAYGDYVIRSMTILPDIHIAIEKVENIDIKSDLIRTLEDKTDEKSIELLKKYLDHGNSTLRYWTAKTIVENPSEAFNSDEIHKKVKIILESEN
ncbi:MAG: hypothetical protein A2W91_09955 [Bacteroidetes bacterium GWF2_38_335]|nr:MAG: hypothetical protein A2W91_09955 [Bacteroidetes bacterium GWF2_38_335]HBS88049.1 hypothetical protein [Bacteroidales bacterium]